MTSSEKPGLRMKELMEATGLPKSTILYYLDQGLLPEPVKTSPNMAYYPLETVDRIAMIRTMQSRHRLPLKKIKHILDLQKDGQDVSPIVRLVQTIFDGGHDADYDMKGFLGATGLTRRQAEELIKTRIILPLESGRFDAEDVAIGKILARGLGRGLEPKDIDFFPRLGERIVDEQMKLRRRLTHHMPMDQDAEMTMQLIEAGRAIRSYVFERLFQLRVISMQNPKDEKGLHSPGDAGPPKEDEK